jgi:hypothetical protein
LRLAGAVLLAAGWLAGLVIFVAAREDAPTGDLAYGIGWERRYSFQMERFGGKAAVMADDLAEWFSALWHGQKLAYTVAVLCTGAALLCFLLAGAAAPPLPPGEASKREAADG